MRKLNYLVLLVLGTVLISCGGKNSENKETNIAEVKEAIIKECLISELEDMTYNSAGYAVKFGKNIVKEGSKDLFTGIAVLKDQSDSIIQKVEIKKGWLLRDTKKAKISKGKYITISDLNYEDLEITNGFELKVDETDSKIGFYNIEEYLEYKNGAEYNAWQCWVNPEINQIQYKWFYINGKDVSYIQNPSTCMEGYYRDYDSKYYMERESNEEYNRILECLKKELPRFDYWTEK